MRHRVAVGAVRPVATSGVQTSGSRGGFSAHLSFVTVSMRVMSAGDGYEYLLRSVVAGDGNRSLSMPLTRYYEEAGTPSGVACRV